MSFRSNLEQIPDITIPPAGGIWTWHNLISIKEPGELLALILYAEGAGGSGIQWDLKFDDIAFELVFERYLRIRQLYETMPNQREGITVANYDTVNDWYCTIITLRLKWEKSFTLKVRNPAAVNVDVSVQCYYDRLAELPRPMPVRSVQEPGVLTDPEM